MTDGDDPTTLFFSFDHASMQCGSAVPARLVCSNNMNRDTRDTARIYLFYLFIDSFFYERAQDPHNPNISWPENFGIF